MQLNPDHFNSFLAGIGQMFSWRRSDACPCTTEASGAADPACPQCFGRGRIWGITVQGLAGISGAKVQRDWATFGVYEQGDVVLTLPGDSPLYAMNQFDRVVMVNSTIPFSVVLRETKLPFGGVERFDRCFWLDADKNIVDGGFPAVASDGTLTWESYAAFGYWVPGYVMDPPPPGTPQFTLTGRKHPEFFCYGPFPQDRAHHSGAPLPRLIVLRRFDLFGRGVD